MSELVLIDDEHNEKRNNVAQIMLAGGSEYTAGRRLGMKVVEVRAYWRQWQDMLQADNEGRDVAKDHLNRTVKHYDNLIEKSYEVLKDLDDLIFDEKVSAQKNATLKNIADYEAKRVDMLQKAGLLDGADLGDELAERERREQDLLNILRNDLCPNCQAVVRDRLTALYNVVEGTVID